MAGIGFIGLGAMGLHVAKRLCSAGHSVKVAVHKNPEPANALAELGGSIVPSFADVVRDVECIITIVPEDPQSCELFSNDTLVDGFKSTLLRKDMRIALAEAGDIPPAAHRPVVSEVLNDQRR